LLFCACGSSNGNGNGDGVDCDSIPACYTDAVTALKACVDEPALTVSGGTVNSGVVQGRQCTGGTTTVSFSDYSERPTGTVPIPSRITIESGGAPCAELSRVSGSRSGTSIERPGEDDVFVGWWEGGRSVDCGPGYIVDTADLAACPEAIQLPEAQRDPLAVRFRNADDTYTDLFVCN
jgi:hypothetical protein